MRIAFAANPALGHVLPLIPLALAARDAGHDAGAARRGGDRSARGRRWPAPRGVGPARSRRHVRGDRASANAAACAAAGVGCVLKRDAWTAPGIRAAVIRALGDPGLAAAAQRLRSEIEAMPPPALVLPDLEALAASAGRA